MGLLQIETEHLLVPPAPTEQAWPALHKFLSDMDADRSSFFHLPAKSSWEAEIAKLQPLLAQRIPQVDTFIHLGIGGSSLGAETIVRGLAGTSAPTFHFCDNIDPDCLHDIMQTTSPQRALIYVVTKSGTTMETLGQFLCLYKWLEKKLGPTQARNHLVFCTDPTEGALRKLSQQWKVPTFDIPPRLGGRFSALSAVGLFPALVAGIDCKGLLKGAAQYREQMLEKVARNELPEVADLAYRMAQHYLENQRNITVFMPYSQKLKTLSAWFTQLWAESLGKNSKGMTPVAALGATDQHSILQLLRDGPQDKVVGFVEVAGFQHVLEMNWEISWSTSKMDSIEMLSGLTMNQLMDSELIATQKVLTNNKRPNFKITLPRLNTNMMGQILYFLETLTALTGYYMGIDPFDQPGVEEGKKITKERLAALSRAAASSRAAQ